MPLLAVAGSLVVVAALLALLGYAPGPALAALARGALGSPAALTATALKATPLLLTGLAVAVCFRSGVWNIGAEGQLYAGTFVATWVALAMGALPGIVLLPLTIIGAFTESLCPIDLDIRRLGRQSHRKT